MCAAAFKIAEKQSDALNSWLKEINK